MKPIRVLIVDDSALMRKLLTELLSNAADIQVVGTAQDPYVARERIKTLNPDVLTLDVEMPRMNGLTFLRHLMRLRPMPVVMVSSLTARGAEVTLRALELGAVDFIRKPDIQHWDYYSDELIEKIRMAASVRLRARPALNPSAPGNLKPKVSYSLNLKKMHGTVLAIGASTGGTEAIREVLLGLPQDTPGVVIVQHIPAGFSAAFAERMNRQTDLVVKEAEDRDVVTSGHVYIAPGDRHLLLERVGGKYLCRISNSSPVNRHRPSVDVLFHSVAQVVGNQACAALLTGMGTDGAQGLKKLFELGVYTVAQDQDTSVVWGMPGEAVRLGAALEILPLAQIAAALYQAASAKEMG